MKTCWLWVGVFASVIWALVSVGGCKAIGDAGFSSSSGNNSTSSSSGNTGGDGSGGDCLFCQGGNGGDYNPGGKLSIDPPTATLEVVDGVIPTQGFKAKLGGEDVTTKVTWVYEKPDVGAVGGNGIFVPTGKVGGVGKLLALYNKQEAEGSVTVNVKLTVNTANLPPADQAVFDNPVGPDPSMKWLYPFDKTVMPLRIMPPEMQWNGVSAGDVYRIRLSSKHITYTEYFQAANPAAPVYLMAQDQWENVQFSGTGPVSDPLKVELARKNANGAYQPVLTELRIAQGIVYGSVYYWQLPGVCQNSGNNGRILRIKPSTTSSDEFYPSNSCWGCHTVSRDGTQLMGVWENGTPFPMQTLDLTTNPVSLGPIVQATGITGVFAAFNDDGSKILVSNNSSSGPNASSSALNIIDSTTGQSVLASALGPGCGEPAWSPDGTKIAGICNMTNGGWTFDASTGDLIVADLNAAQNQVVQALSIVKKADASAGRPAYPSFSPDSKYLAYGRPTTGSRTTGNGKIWLVGVDGKNPVELLIASGDDRSFNPVFAPKSAGGYTWLVFISRRDYGHQMVNANRQQLWVTAISDPPVAGDPSNPPFYMRGQEMCGKSENAYYALDPCKEVGEECEHGIECCNKSCIYDDATMKYICKDPDPNECIPTGSGTCVDDIDCCDFTDDVKCLNGFCEKEPPT